MFERLTKYAGKLADRNMNVEFGGGTFGLEDFVDDFYELDGFADTRYFETLERHSIDTSEGIDSCDIDHGGIDLIRACITWRVRGDRFCDGLLAAQARSGFLDRCLSQLKELDEGRSTAAKTFRP